MNEPETWAGEPHIDRLRYAYDLMQHDSRKALAELQALSDLGSVMARAYLGAMYENGTGIEVDIIQAEKWYRLALDSGSNQALLSLGRLYFDKRDYRRAEDVFRVGITKNFLPAMYWLAKVYRREAHTAARFQEACALLEKASVMGHVYAKRDLSFLLMSGRCGISENTRRNS
jgi:TPR repeat protein